MTGGSMDRLYYFLGIQEAWFLFDLYSSVTRREGNVPFTLGRKERKKKHAIFCSFFLLFLFSFKSRTDGISPGSRAGLGPVINI